MGTQVYRLGAFDADALTESMSFALTSTRFVYKGVGKPTTDIFEVETHLGDVRLRSQVDDFVGGVFQLNVSVFDADLSFRSSDEQRSASTLINVGF